MNHALSLRLRATLAALLLTLACRGNSHAVEMPGSGVLAELIMRFDTNGDSKIDSGEWQMGVTASFSEIDADNDGKITAVEIDELSGPLEREVGSIVAILLPKLIKPLLMSMDADKDGIVSREEFAKQVDTLFAKLDADMNAELTRAELIDLPVKLLAPAGK
jgi:Ca2+-binding EF-hand superfamily protein